MSQVEVRFFAGAVEAFGDSRTEVEGVSDLAGLVSVLGERGGTGLAEVLEQCSFFVDGEHRTNLAEPIPADCRVDVLPPFAGG